MMKIAKYTFGVGDRFAHQAQAQLRAFEQMWQAGAEVVPVWNKSYREHKTVGSEPESVRNAAQHAVETLNWKNGYYVDADHIRLDTVDAFLPTSDFFTIDVADSIGQPAVESDVNAFVEKHLGLMGRLTIPGIDEPFVIGRPDVERIAGKYLKAVQDAGAIYRHIAEKKGEGNFITEVSMDETDSPQTPTELLVILAALAHEGVPAQTIAPKFTGRFNKGVDYVGNLEQFAKEFREDLAVIAFAVKQYNLPDTLKLSVHSGSDKFSIYKLIREALAEFDAGLHIKTAGTTWLEEVIGLAESGGDGLSLAKEIYTQALQNREALCAPYATVIDIDPGKLPTAETVQGWSADEYTQALRHEPNHPNYNPHLRQLLHVGYKVAAQMGDRYISMLETCEPTVAKNVTYNLFERHMKPLFVKGS